MAQKKSSSKKSELREECGKCGSTEFSIGEDSNQKRYCGSCTNVWGPMSEEDIKLLASQKDNMILKTENAVLKDRVYKLEMALQNNG